MTTPVGLRVEPAGSSRRPPVPIHRPIDHERRVRGGLRSAAVKVIKNLATGLLNTGLQDRLPLFVAAKKNTNKTQIKHKNLTEKKRKAH
jgi:hypothetical protein